MSRAEPRRRPPARAAKPAAAARAPRARPAKPAAAPPTLELQHDHAALQLKVRALGVVIRAFTGAPTAAARAACATALAGLREDLFLHFAREEEALVPFVAANAPTFAAAVTGLVDAHDAICGALARMGEVIRAGTAPTITAIFDRFTTAYATHATRERDLLAQLAAALTARQRTALATLLRGV